MGDWLAHLWLWALMGPIYAVVRAARPLAAQWPWVVAAAAVSIGVLIWLPAVARVALRVAAFILRLAIRGYFAYFCLLTGLVLPFRAPGAAWFGEGVSGAFSTLAILLGAAIWLIVGIGVVLSLPRQAFGGARP
ncbi:MAG: hypothetical protein CHACPFDD_01612 [Phycisphaerae bacterium]|nr:hypothetical protein [Phycisphaerae bacterium]